METENPLKPIANEDIVAQARCDSGLRKFELSKEIRAVP